MKYGPKRNRGGLRVDMTTGRIVGNVRGGWANALLAAGAAYLLGRWQDRRQDLRDLVRGPDEADSHLSALLPG